MSEILLYAAIIYAIQGIVWAVAVRTIVTYKGYNGGHWGLWGFLFQFIAALVAFSLPSAEMVQIRDKLDELLARSGGEGTSSPTPKPAPSPAPSSKTVSRDGTWKCKSCGEINESSSISCKNCGEYK